MSGAQNAPRCRPFVTIGFSLGCFFTTRVGQRERCVAQRGFSPSRCCCRSAGCCNPGKDEGFLGDGVRAASGMCEGGDTPHPVLACGGLFLCCFFASLPRLRQENQGVISNKISWQKKRDRGISRSKNLLEPTACRGNKAATTKKGGTVMYNGSQHERIRKSPDQEIPRSRNPG